jgi:trimeric autotransporter adhesin
MRHVIFTFLLLLGVQQLYAVRTYAPNSSASITGTGSYCSGASASPIVFTYNTCNAGVGSLVGVSLTVRWFTNTTSSTTGGTAVGTSTITCSTSGTGSVSYTPATSAAGTTYYYCTITWSGFGTCRGSGTLTSSSAVPVTVIPNPGSISGGSSVCNGSSMTLTNAIEGGTWSSSNVARATVNASTGAVTGVSAGSVTISYSTGCGTAATQSVTVNAAPSGIVGASTVCTGSSTTFTDATVGGTWSTSNASVVSITAAGRAYGITAGSASISYTIGTCAASRAVSVLSAPSTGDITGSDDVCFGSFAGLGASIDGGTWSSSNASIASVDATGMVSGEGAGLATISYTIANACGTSVATKPMIVNPLPLVDLITGTPDACVGGVSTLSDTTVGGTWSTDDFAIATIDATGNVTGVSAGTTNVTYSKTTGCGTDYQAIAFNVHARPTAGTLSGSSILAVGASATLTASVAGGTWSSSSASIASVSTSGRVRGMSPGNAVITYTVANPWCSTPTTHDVEVGFGPDTAVISGNSTICDGSTHTYTSSLSGGAWSSTSTSTVSISSTGVATALRAGSATIRYSITNRYGTSVASFSVTVLNAPTIADTIVGASVLCARSTVTLTNTTTGGTWSSSNVAIATVSAIGEVYGVSAGSATITYTVSNICGTATRTAAVSIRATPAAIVGDSTICLGNYKVLRNATVGGTWSAVTGTGRVGINDTGRIIGLLEGNATVVYSAAGCSVSHAMAIGEEPRPISGTARLCAGTTVVYTNPTVGGTWSTSNSSIASVNAAGTVFGVSGGTANITYTRGVCFALQSVLVDVNPAPISGPTSICRSGTVTYTNSVSGGTWIRINGTGTTSISTAGVVTGLTVGTATIAYQVGTCQESLPISIVNGPADIAGATTLCTGSTTAFTNTVSGGTWSSSNADRATVSSTGVVYGLSAGTATITYSIATCFRTRSITIQSMPAAIAGPTSVCNGSTITLSNTIAGGSWSRTNGTGQISITSAGAVRGVRVGEATVSYTIGSCRVTTPIIVNTTPGSIGGATNICNGSATTLTNATTGGTWTSSNASIATINSSTGSVTGVAVGGAAITYAVGGCQATRSISVITTPGAISGATTVCPSGRVTLTNATSGGTWSRTNGTGTGSINTSGMFTGSTAGTVTVSYTIGSCRSTLAMTVLGTPAAITGASSICAGSNTTFSNTTALGTWSTSSAAIASVAATTGVVTGVTAGTATISYATGCGTTATRSITVSGIPTVTPGTISSVTSGTASVTMPYSTTGSPTLYSISWGTAAASAGFVPVGSATLSGSPLSISVPASASEGTYTGSITVSNGSCGSSSATFAFTLVGDNINMFAGNRSASYTGDGDAAVSAGVNHPYDVAADSRGNVYIADYENSVVRMVAPTGIITTIAGTGSVGYSGDGGAATAAQLSHPISVTVDATGNLYVSDHDNHVVRKIDQNGTITTVAGTGTPSYTGDGGAATAATLNYPSGIEVDNSGNLYICDYVNLVVRKVSNTGTITTVAGNGVAGYSGDGGAATAARLGTPHQLTVDASGNLHIADYDNNVVRKVNAAGTISTIAGTGSVGYTGDGGAATAATLNHPYGIAIDRNGNILVSEKYNHTVRKITTTGIISTLAGHGLEGYFGDGGLAVSAKLSQPMGVTVDTANRVYIADNANRMVRILGSQNRTPFFTGGSARTLNVCRNATATSIDALLTARDLDTAQSITWSLATAPARGTFAGSNTTSSTGSALTVSGFTYRPDSGYVGADSFVVRVSDGHTSSTTIVRVSITSGPDAGTVVVPDLVCTSSTIRATNAVSGGTWSVSNTALATVTPALGFVSGIAIGTVTVTYSVSGSCGTSFSTANVRVVSYPSASVTAATPCTGYATAFNVAGTTGDTIRYSLNGGATVDTVNRTGSLTFPTPTLTSAYSFRLISIRNSSCTTNIDRLLTITPVSMVWQGGTTGRERDWKTASNWNCGTVPSATDSIYIPNGLAYFPVLSGSDSGYVRHIAVSRYGLLNINDSSRLFVAGNLTDSNNILGSGTLVMNGSSAQTIRGTGRATNVTLSNAAGVSIARGALFTVRGALTVTNTTFATNDSLILGADSAETARVAPLVSASITGRVRVQQYIPGGYRRYRFLSHPFNSYIDLSQMQRNIDITGRGGATNGFTPTSTNAASAFLYNPLLGNSADAYDRGWREFTTIYGGDDSNRYRRYQGIRVFIRGSKGEGLGITTYTPSAATMVQGGELNQGRQVVPMVKGTGANQDFNLLGNPYASPIDLGTVLFNARANGNIVGSAFYVWNPYLGTGGQFVTVSISTTTPTPYYLQAGAAFEVRTANNNDTLVFNESDKATTFTTRLLKPNTNDVVLKVYDADYNEYDALTLKFDQSAAAIEENTNDAAKRMGPDFNFYSVAADNKRLAIDVRPFEVGNTIPLGVASNTAQEFVVRAENVAIPAGNVLFLHDKVTGTYTELSQGSEYRFNVTKERKSQGDNRLELVMKPAAEVAAATEEFAVVMSPNPATDEVKLSFTAPANQEVSIAITDISGVAVYQNHIAKNTGMVNVPLNKLAPGVYVVALQSGDRTVTKRLVKE